LLRDPLRVHKKNYLLSPATTLSPADKNILSAIINLHSSQLCHTQKLCHDYHPDLVAVPGAKPNVKLLTARKLVKTLQQHKKFTEANLSPLSQKPQHFSV
jgi:hypothetical protein